jgi:hypothetical protein
MKKSVRFTLALSIAAIITGSLSLAADARGPAASVESPATLNAEDVDADTAFVLSSTDFGDPCTQNQGSIPRIYDNRTANNVDVSFKIVNTGSTNVFIDGTGFVIPPVGPQMRPRIVRLTLAPGASLGIRSQPGDCGWTATVRPH